MITPDHEILTMQNGWQPIFVCDKADKLATVNLATGKVEYQTPEWTSEELTSNDLFVMRHNRVELSCKPETKIIGKFSKTSAWQKLICKNVKSVEFTMRLYIGEILVKPINMKVNATSYSGEVYSPLVANGNYLVRKSDKIFLVGC